MSLADQLEMVPPQKLLHSAGGEDEAPLLIENQHCVFETRNTWSILPRRSDIFEVLCRRSRLRSRLTLEVNRHRELVAGFWRHFDGALVFATSRSNCCCRPSQMGRKGKPRKNAGDERARRAN